MVNKDESDFMLEEYRQIAQAFFNLKSQVNSALKLYLTIISITSTAIISVLTLKYELLSNNTLLLGGYSIEIIAGSGFFILALIGITILANMIGTRVQMLKYARTVNCIRGFFNNKFSDIEDYLRLPTNDNVPLFFETPGRAFFWYIVMIALLNSVLVVVGINMYIGQNGYNLIISAIVMIVGTILQVCAYYLFCITQEKTYKKQNKKS